MLDERTEKKYVLEMYGKYSEKAIDHARNPRNVGNIPKADGFGQESGECGDTMGIWVKVRDGVVTRATFWTDGCGATIACGSAVTELAIGKTVEEAMAIDKEAVLEALDGLPEDHHHCAELAAAALHSALEDYLELIRFPWKRPYLERRA